MTEVAEDPRETAKQLRPGLWQTVNERYPGSMIRNEEFVPQSRLAKPLSECRVTFISSSGVHLKSDPPLDVCHPFGDFRFRRVPSTSRHEDLIIHQLKYPHDDADLDVNVIFPIERLQELAADRTIGELTPNSSASSATTWTRSASSRRSRVISPRPWSRRSGLTLRCSHLPDRSAISPSD